MSTAYDIFESARDAVVVIAADGVAVYRNPAARALGDWPPAAAREGLAAALGTVREQGTATVEWGDHVAELSPCADGTLCIARDVSALKARLRQVERMMVDTQGVAHLGTWEWDITQPTATWSDELYRIYGLTPSSYTPSYERYLTMVHPDDRQRVMDATNRVFHEHVPYSHDERIFRPDGTMRYLHTWAFPVLDAAGKLTHLIGVCQDITDRALADEALQRANLELESRVRERTQQLEGALRDLDAFNSMVSHDLRAPLNVIGLGIEVLARDPNVAGGSALSHVERIRRAVANMVRLVNDLLEFARLGDAALRPTEIDVTAVCAEIVAELRAGAPGRDVRVVIEPDLRLTADATLFRVVLANLLANAWKYTQRRPEAEVEVGMRGGALFVRDNGVGFDMAESHRLFAPFERLNSAKDFAGTGVGLATVRRILDRHGGAISAESAPGAGATFLVRLPGVTRAARDTGRPRAADQAAT